MKNILLFVALISIFFSCSQATIDEPLINLTVNAEFVNDSYIRFIDPVPAGVLPEWDLKGSKLEVKVSKNLTSNPYNLKLTITPPPGKNGEKPPVLTYISDFDRKIVEGDRYRLITTIILHGNAAFIPGQTGGKIEYYGTNDKYYSNGIGLGSELEITIASLGETVATNSNQKLVLSGFFSKDDNNDKKIVIGEFSITIEGNNIIDTRVF